MLDQQSAGGSLGLTVTFIYRNKPAHTVTIEPEQLDRFLARYSPDNSCIGYLVMRHEEGRSCAIKL